MRTRKRVTFSATTSWQTEMIVVPKKLMIQRVRAISDNSLAEIALAIRETATADATLDVPLEYAYAPSPLDSEENIFVAPTTTSTATTGNIWIAVKSNPPSTVRVQIEYQQ